MAAVARGTTTTKTSLVPRYRPRYGMCHAVDAAPAVDWVPKNHIHIHTFARTGAGRCVRRHGKSGKAVGGRAGGAEGFDEVGPDRMFSAS